MRTKSKLVRFDSAEYLDPSDTSLWSVSLAARRAAVDRRTLVRGLDRAGIRPNYIGRVVAYAWRDLWKVFHGKIWDEANRQLLARKDSSATKK